MKVLDLFSGIGGFSLGLERAGMKTVAFCEFNPKCQKVLSKHWPNVHIHDDIRGLDGTQYRGTIDVVCGGFPCQDLSQAGGQAGFKGERSSLYREMLRVISECGPQYAIFENVPGLLAGESGRWFAKFLYDLAEIGYDAQWHCIPASYVGAPHQRDRVWIIAYPKSINELQDHKKQAERQKQEPGESFSRASVSRGRDSSDPNGKRCERIAKIAECIKQQVEFMRGSENEKRRFNLSEPILCGADDGVSGRLDRLRGLGNAVVPQIPEAIGRAIMNIKD